MCTEESSFLHFYRFFSKSVIKATRQFLAGIHELGRLSVKISTICHLLLHRIKNDHAKTGHAINQMDKMTDIVYADRAGIVYADWVCICADQAAHPHRLIGTFVAHYYYLDKPCICKYTVVKDLNGEWCAQGQGNFSCQKVYWLVHDPIPPNKSLGK